MICFRQHRSFLFAILCFLLCPRPASGDVLLQGFYWDVPSPQAGQADAPWWWDHLAGQARDLSRAGFTGVWIPPVVKGANARYSVGYDPYDDYDIGGKNQHGYVSSRYGTREQLERCVAMLRANGLDVIVDMVENHRDGDTNLTMRYNNAYGAADGGRFPKTPGDFHQSGIPQDPDVPEETGGQIGMFGPDLAPINGRQHSVYNGLIDAGDWLTRALDVQGYRLDYVKGISTDWLRAFLNSKAMRGKFAVGEYYDGNLEKVSAWVQSGMRGRASAFDFPLRDLLKQMCDQNGAFDMRRLERAGLAGRDPRHAVTFVENHDTDHERGNQIVRGKMLAYALILTSEGLPTVFYRDYSPDAGSYHLKPLLDRLIAIRECLAFGATQTRWKDADVFAYERAGGRRLLTVLNDNPGASRTLTLQTGFAPGQALHDYAEHAPDVRADAQGRVTLAVPANVDGSGYVCYAPTGLALRPTARTYAVTQDYEGAQDLDIRPAEAQAFTPVCRVWAAKGSVLRVRLAFDAGKDADATRLLLQWRGPAPALPQWNTFARSDANAVWSLTAPETGWQTFSIRAQNTPPVRPRVPFRLRLAYTAPLTF